MLPGAGGDYSSHVSHVVDEILRTLRLAGPWQPLAHSGIAKKIYVTDRVVIGIASDHRSGVSDLRTESVAAPIVRAAGIRAPAMLAFDDTRALIDRPWAVWERVPGTPLRERWPRYVDAAPSWRAVGAELRKLHDTVTRAPDPRGWLDAHARAVDPRASLPDLPLSDDQRTWLDRVAARLEPHTRRAVTPRFLHGDCHGMNVIVGDDGALHALIDWGDAGWGDPAIDLAELPVDAWRLALEGYGALGDDAIPLLLWQRLDYALAHLAQPKPRAARLDELARLRDVSPWGDWLL